MRTFVEACLASYRSAESATDGLIRTDESLPERYAEHGEMVGLLDGVRPPAGHARLDRPPRAATDV